MNSGPLFTLNADLPERSIRITQELIDRYAQISGDFNPIHVDAAAAAASDFGGTIAHGCIPIEPVFQSLLAWSGSDRLPIGTRLRLRYRAPSRPGDTVRSRMRVVALAEGAQGGVIKLSFACLNQLDQPVIEGECEFPA